MKLDKKKVSETCKTILSSADLNTITEKKVRRQVEVELDLEDKILDDDPYKGIVKEIVNKIINDLQQKSESSRSPPQVSQAKKTASRAKTTTKPTSTNKKSRKIEAKSKEPSKDSEDDSPKSKPLNSKARSKVSKQESSPISKTQTDKVQIKISKTNGEVSPTNRGEQSKTTEVIPKADDNISSSSSRPVKSNVMSKSTIKIEQSNKFEEELESVLPTKRTTKRSETNNEEKQKPNVSRSRVKRKINVSSDTDDNESDSALVSTAKESDLEEPASPPPKRPKQINSSDEDEEPSSKRRVKEKSIEEDIKQSRRKIDTVEDGGAMMALEDKLLAQNSDIIPVLGGDDVESDNTIKDDDRGMLKRTPEPEGEEGSKSQNNSESIGGVKQEPNRLKVESTSPKRTIDSVGVKDDDSDQSSLEDDEPRKKKRGIRRGKLVNNKTAIGKDEKNETTIKNLKSFILKCGVRKNWSKELADCSTASSKIKKLKKILADLGVEGRATIKKCKKAKKSLELEAELRAMDVDNIISDDIKETRKTRASRGIFNPVRRQVSRVTRSSPEYDDSSSKDIHSGSE